MHERDILKACTNKDSCFTHDPFHNFPLPVYVSNYFPVLGKYVCFVYGLLGEVSSPPH